MEKKIEIILAIGSAIIKPARMGFFIDSQLAKAIRKPEKIILAIKKITRYPFKLSKKIFNF